MDNRNEEIDMLCITKYENFRQNEQYWQNIRDAWLRVGAGKDEY